MKTYEEINAKIEAKKALVLTAEEVIGYVERKGLELIAANDVTAEGSGFAADTNQVTLLAADGSVESLPLMSKEEVAHQIWDRVSQILQAK